MNLKTIAYKIRHSKLLENQEGLWNLIRKPFHFIIDPLNKGVKLHITKNFFIRIPASFYNASYANYEREAVLKTLDWALENQEATIIDIGTSWGYFSTILLHASPKIKVIGIDSDLTSIKVSKWVCSYVTNDRYSVICGLISEKSTTNYTLQQAIKMTEESISNQKITLNPSDTKYVNLDTTEAENTPIYTVDQLFLDAKIGNNILIKCDIEGAEMLALKGASEFISKYKPTMLVSVHPELILNYQSSKEEVASFLKKNNYNVDLLAIDHEEHWWCTPIL